MYKLSPSDFAYLYEECKLCYYLKVKHGITQPSMPMPGVFSAINTRLQGNLVGKNLKSLSCDLPDCEVVKQEGFVDSLIIPETSVFIKGKYDLLVQNTDSTYTIVDLKISQPNIDKVDKYKTQLSAYKFALENPKVGEAIKVTRLALLVFYPDSVTFANNVSSLGFPPKWLDVPLDENGFIAFMKQIDNLLSSDMPEECPTCKWCQYRHVGEYLTHQGGSEKDVVNF